MIEPWENMISRAVALGVMPFGEDHTIRFSVYHEPDCSSQYSAYTPGNSGEWVKSKCYCTCRPMIMWREVCEPVEEIHILIDKSSSTNGAI
jgi:hypothetical protein